MRKSRLFFGIAAGIICVGWYLGFYFLEKKLFFHLGVYWGSWLPFAAAMLFAALRERSQAEGEYSWQQALRACFSVFVVGAAIFQVFYFVFFNYGDPGLATLQQEVIRENLARYQEQLGPSVSEQLGKGANVAELEYGVRTALLTFARSTIGGFLVSLAMAFLAKKE
jgi:hypothetical protein